MDELRRLADQGNATTPGSATATDQLIELTSAPRTALTAAISVAELSHSIPPPIARRSIVRLSAVCRVVG
jgi:hypothetical protein